MNKELLYEPNDLFGGFFNEWRLKRVEKLEFIFGVDWFNKKTILELGCGHGHIGLYLETLGADVTFCDARQSNLNAVLKKNQNAKTILINNENIWDLKKKFDLVIHFGLLYHVENWRQDLKIALNHGKYIALESAINTFKENIEIKIKNTSYNFDEYGSINKKKFYPSLKLIEGLIKKLKYKAKRYDTKFLNIANNFVYNKPCNIKYDINLIKNNPFYEQLYVCRKFWIIER